LSLFYQCFGPGGVATNLQRESEEKPEAPSSDSEEELIVTNVEEQAVWMPQVFSGSQEEFSFSQNNN
jgi:hypothetical protein